MNPIRGAVDVELAGEMYTLRFDWNALAAIEAAQGDSPNLFDPHVVASVAAIGFAARHPELTAERIMELSPPLMPFAGIVQQALQLAYFGPESPDVSDDAKKKSGPERAGFWRRIQRRWRRG